MSNEIDKFLNRNIDEVIDWTNTLTDMIDSPEKYGYADDTLRGILEVIEETGNITDAQKRAIQNIRHKPSGKYGIRHRRW